MLKSLNLIVYYDHLCWMSPEAIINISELLKQFSNFISNFAKLIFIHKVRVLIHKLPTLTTCHMSYYMGRCLYLLVAML